MRIPLHLVVFYFFAYVEAVFWKRYWNDLIMKLSKVDRTYEWSLLRDITIRKDF